MTENTKFLDLDSVDVGPKVVIKIQGIEHELKPISVGDFIENTRLLQGLSANGTDFEKEVDAIAIMLCRAFPTMNVELLKKLPMAHLNKMLDFANQNNGANQVAEEAKVEAEANPLPTGA